MVAMVNLSGTAGPISIKCGQVGAEPARLMPTQTDRQDGEAAEACRMEKRVKWANGRGNKLKRL